MFIIKATQKRGPAYPDSTPYTAPDGTRHASYPRDLLEEIPEPAAPEDYSDALYYRNEIDDAPYVVYTRKSDEQLREAHNASITAQIAGLDGGHPTARPVREFALKTMEKFAADAGLTVEQLREANYGYRKMKELDEQITALREQLQ